MRHCPIIDKILENAQSDLCAKKYAGFMAQNPDTCGEDLRQGFREMAELLDQKIRADLQKANKLMDLLSMAHLS